VSNSYNKTLGGTSGTVWYLSISTDNWNSGQYKLKVRARNSTKTYYFNVEGVSVTADVPSVVYLGQSVTIKGTTNIAETGSIYDYGTPNYVNVTICYPNGTKAWPTNGNMNVSVKSDGTWECPVSWVPILSNSTPTGSYKLVVKAVATKNETDTETYYILVKEPTITINLAPSYVRGEGLYIEGTSNLGANVALSINVTGGNINKYPLLITDTSNPRSAPANSWHPNAVIPYENFTVYTSADGSWQTEKLYINPNASRTTYTVEVKVINRTSILAVGTINVVKATLTAKLSMSSLTLGSQVTLKGTSPVEDIFLLTSDKNVFQNVGEIQSNDKGTATDSPPHTPMHIKTIAGGNTFEVTLKVCDNASYGTYTLYVIASPDGIHYDLSKDAYLQLPVTIAPVGILYAPDTFTITQGSAKKIFIEVNAKPNDVVYACYTLEGHGVDIKKGARPSSNAVSFSNHNQLVKWNETANGTYWMFTTIYPYYNATGKYLESSYNATYDKLLPVGTYTLTIHLYTRDPDSGIFEETASKEITMDVQPVVMTVTCPSEVVKGEPIKLVIHENRVNCDQYDHIYVVMDLGTKLRKYLGIALNESGYAVVDIPTGDITPGTYKIYIRDTMGTVNGTVTAFIDNYYNLKPTSGYALRWKADDDVLVIKTVKILASSEEITPTPTPTATATPTPTPTPTPKPTATPTPKPTATPTPTPTTTATPTPTPTPKKKTPGFEAVFAIAGLIAVAYLLRRREL